MPHTREIQVTRQTGALSPQAIALTLGAVLIVLLAVYFIFLRAPDTGPPVDAGVVPAATPEERGDSARNVIAELENDGGQVDYAEAHTRAREYHQAGRLADAQLLYFFAARGNYAPAAFDLATMYDPNHYSNASSLMDEPDAFQAYKWYTQARDAGNESAAGRIAELKAWAEQAARDGDSEAERLLLQWE